MGIYSNTVYKKNGKLVQFLFGFGSFFGLFVDLRSLLDANLCLFSWLIRVNILNIGCYINQVSVGLFFAAEFGYFEL